MKAKLTFSERALKNALSSTLGKFLNWQTFLVLTVFAIGVSWIPDGLSSIFSQFFPEKYFPYFQLFAGLLILSVLFWLGNRLSKKQMPKFDIVSEDPSQTKNLILFLSPSKDVSNINSIEDFKNIKTPWQMPITAIQYHLPVLENVFVILSEKSKENFEEFKKLVNRLFPQENLNIVPIGLDKNINFENMEDLEKIIEETYNLIKKEYGSKEREIIIDVTGGQKLVSIIGAMYTLAGDRKFQYVSTTDYKVKSFDIRFYGEE